MAEIHMKYIVNVLMHLRNILSLHRDEGIIYLNKDTARFRIVIASMIHVGDCAVVFLLDRCNAADSYVELLISVVYIEPVTVISEDITEESLYLFISITKKCGTYGDVWWQLRCCIKDPPERRIPDIDVCDINFAHF